MWTPLLLSVALAQERPHVVLLSLDTTRADALSCYGTPPGPHRVTTPTTPTLDALAAQGVRFERFFANAPSTLTSHTTMLTGLDPHGHAVVRNGFPVDPDLPTLAERLADEGWDTVAILGAAALEQAMGLDRGFRVYDDDTPALQGLMYQDRADGVTRRALAAVDARPNPEDPLFLLVHYYDPHTPYAPPPELAAKFVDPTYTGNVVGTGARFKALARSTRTNQAPAEDLLRAADLYLGEVAFVDQQVGVLLEGLEARGLLEHALVVAVADHGETLADHPTYAWSHGSNVGWEVMRIPLIVRGYGLPIARRAVVHRQAAMDGLARTIEQAVGLDPTLGTGLDFYDLWRAGPVRDGDGWPERPTIPVRVEATRPRQAQNPDGWNNSTLNRGVFAGGWGVWSSPFIPAPWTFYELGPPPDAGVMNDLIDLVDDWDARAPPHVSGDMAPATKRALKALGYLD